ncbi:preprotein translocase subunit SecY (chloroplast) [Guillardia theta]|uniref:Protein translocase subunit SecY n=2 Tax=Guillardia theta TaxID=55529 RepID=SECY_GUITH|nr:preprotein translocase subunit SecY [Guillardia theta]P28527.2 RecName: Full=Protein translocase subunit SecY [Guillardia theta]pir/S20577/ preprotein translocase secY - Cryptomonas sp. chloroplast [Cryptomonas sp.]AAC35720.1 SecY-type transporter protein [Guillardia theta]
MNTSIKSIKKQDLKDRIVFTLFLIVMSRLGTFLPIPGVDHDAFYQSIISNPLVNFLNVFSGGGFASIGVFALGIVPYINASIIVQLATNSIPSLEKLQKEEGELGRQKIVQLTRYVALVWALIQSIGVSFWVRPYVFNWDLNFVFAMSLTLTIGSMLIMWFSEQITEKGIGNGPSLLIFINIISGLPKLLQSQIQSTRLNIQALDIFVLVFIFSVMIIGIIFIQEGIKRIPIISARQLGKGQMDNKTSYLPLKLNQSGVMPIIFASAVLVLPAYLAQLVSNEQLRTVLHLFDGTSNNKLLYLLFYFTLILFFSYFYTSLILNPNDVSKNLKKMESSIYGVRPGKATTEYLQKTLNRLTFLGALFLAFIAIVPNIIETLTNLSVFKGLGGTSLLIIVGVQVDTSKQIQTYLISKNYETIVR